MGAYLRLHIIVGTITAVLVTELIGNIAESGSDESRYLNNLKKILKTYDAILAKSSVLPDLDDRNIIIVESMQDLVNAQIEIRKPIFYKMQVSCCSFFLLDEKDACVYTIKVNDDVVSDLDILIKEKNFKQKKKLDDDYSLLKNIDKTSIIVLENSKSYKVSPIRDKDEEKKEEKKEKNSDKKNNEVKEENKLEIKENKFEMQEENKFEMQENKFEMQEENKFEKQEENKFEKIEKNKFEIQEEKNNNHKEKNKKINKKDKDNNKKEKNDTHEVIKSNKEEIEIL